MDQSSHRERHSPLAHTDRVGALLARSSHVMNPPSEQCPDEVSGTPVPADAGFAYDVEGEVITGDVQVIAF